MSPDEIKHFLVVYDPAAGEVDVRSFDIDYDTAQRAYVDAEREHGIGSGFESLLRHSEVFTFDLH